MSLGTFHPESGDPADLAMVAATQPFPHDERKALGLGVEPKDLAEERRLTRLYITLRLTAMGLIDGGRLTDPMLKSVVGDLLANHQERLRLLATNRCPVDERIEAFLAKHFKDVAPGAPPRLPAPCFELDRHGVARELSLPEDGDVHATEHLESHRLVNGVLHNPRNDRRTTVGTFHVCEGGLPVPDDKKAVPKDVFYRLFQHALKPPEADKRLPFTAELEQAAGAFVALTLRPLVCPRVSDVVPERRMETRFFAPGAFVSNLDFVESIFGNAGDPFLPENDAGLDIHRWSGHTGCVILAMHLTQLTKKDLGLPHVDQATPRQKRDGMCWKDPAERYNNGVPFKITCRDMDGVIVTLIADNYYGYCKKEVKTQISYAANLGGWAEEEHAGGALCFASYNLGENFQAVSHRYNNRTYEQVVEDYGQWLEVQPEGYAIDRRYPRLVYVREDASFDLGELVVQWVDKGQPRSIPMERDKVYMTPSGYRVHMEKHPVAPSWRLVGTVGEGVFIHKPCTVSGGGKSEISKSLVDYMIYGPIIVGDIESDLNRVDEIFKRDYSTRWSVEFMPDDSTTSRSFLDPTRSLGSAIKLLTPSPTEYNKAYNDWLTSFPHHIWAVAFIIKRFYQPEWGDDWRRHFGVDIVNGHPGHELKFGKRKLVGDYIRVGLFSPTEWRTYKTRQDFLPSAKTQMEDDISASVVVPRRLLTHPGPHDWGDGAAHKFAQNCEYRLFQRPDDAVHRGLDRQTEADVIRPRNFFCNFQPLDKPAVREMVRQAPEWDRFTEPMKRFLSLAANNGKDEYLVCSANPRLVDGVPTKNPRYLQDRPDLIDPFNKFLARMGARLFRAVPADQPVHQPVNAVLMGRRNNAPELKKGVRGLAVYNPLHYQELPELFMDFIASLSGKSPSTTGAGSEGALTKAPFNALLPITDLNNALVSYVLTELAGFSTPAGWVGPDVHFEHDISYVMPELWCRLGPQERDPNYLFRNGYLEKVQDFEHKGQRVLASRLGYRITYLFVRKFFGRVFDNPGQVFDESILQPEKQDLDAYADSVDHIVQGQHKAASQYFQDGSIDQACPPLRSLLWIMVHGKDEQGRTAEDESFRSMFARPRLLASDWYRRRLATQQSRDRSLWERHVADLKAFMDQSHHTGEAERLRVAERLREALARLAQVSAPEYIDHLQGFLGADPMGAA